MTLFCLEQGAHLVLSIDFIKNYLKIDHSDDDELIANLTLTAQQLVENYAGVSFTRRRWKYITTPSRGNIARNADLKDKLFYAIPCNPVEEICAIRLQKAQQLQELTDYSVSCTETLTELALDRKYLEKSTKIICEFISGFSSIKEIPVFLRHAVLLTVSDLYQQRNQLQISSSPHRLPPKVCSMLYGITAKNRLV